MYYASIGIIALIMHVISNLDVLKKNSHDDAIPAHRSYRVFLIGVICYYLVDILWGVMYVLDFTPKILAFIGTELYFIAMVTSVFLWTRFVIAYLKRENIFSTIIFHAGWIFMVLEFIALIINIFVPIVFWYDENGYHTNFARYISHFLQLGLFLTTTVHMMLMATRTRGKVRHRHLAIGIFGLAMTTFIVLQSAFAELPFFSMGYMIGTCALHTFVLEDEKEERRKTLEALIKKGAIQERELGSARQMAYTDPLTGVKNKFAYLEEVHEIEKKISDGTLKDFGLIVFDLNGLKKVNDTMGHEAGDQYIKHGCRLICDTFKDSPVFRIGGDEFVVFIQDENYAKRKSLLGDFEKMVEKNQAEGKVVVSSGYDEFLSDDDNFISIFERADRKMYERKHMLKENGTQTS